MKFFGLLLCLLLLTKVVFASGHHHSEESDERSVEQSAEVHHHHHHHQRRFKRVLETHKRRRCGQKLRHAVMDACKEQCISGSNFDISTYCCSKQCNYQEIRQACCASKAV